MVFVPQNPCMAKLEQSPDMIFQVWPWTHSPGVFSNTPRWVSLFQVIIHVNQIETSQPHASKRHPTRHLESHQSYSPGRIRFGFSIVLESSKYILRWNRHFALTLIASTTMLGWLEKYIRGPNYYNGQSERFQRITNKLYDDDSSLSSVVQFGQIRWH
jgi:hypothetical protein